VRWIEQGAEWKPHWSFIPPRKVSPPAVKDAAWVREPIDRFILASLEARGLRPAPEATRETLLRRLTFDLNGLPPTLDEIDAFVADRSPDAYEKVVDHLLSSPAYGERMAADWLDVARYADSHGYQDDGMRQMWPWRDWVISAFNRNLPVDQFITWQLAGDLLPNPTEEQRLATGFNRNHMQTQEGGVVPEEYRTEYVVDRVNTFGRAFLGLSVECARCHDHKYDPVTQKEFYRLFSFFNSVNETGQIPYSGVPSPSVLLLNDTARQQLDRLDAQISPLESTVTAVGRCDGVDPAAADWKTRECGAFSAWVAAPARTARLSPPGLFAYLPLDGFVSQPVPPKRDPKTHELGKPDVRVSFSNLVPWKKPATLEGDKDRIPKTVPGHVGSAQLLVGDSHIDLADRVGQFERNEPFSLSLWFRLEHAGVSGPLVTRGADLFNGNRGYEIIIHKDGTLTAGLHHVVPDNSIEIATTQPLAPASWHHLALTYDGSSRAAGLRLFLNGRVAPTTVVVDHLQQSIIFSGDEKNKSWVGFPGLHLGHRHDETLDDVTVDEFRAYSAQLTALEVAGLAGDPDPLGSVLSIPADRRTDEQRGWLEEQFRLRVAATVPGALRTLSTLRGQENALLTGLPEVMAMRELPRPRPTFILTRGAYDAPTTQVTPGTPHVLGDLPASSPQNRLGLARWLIAPTHPLTSRVVVNRYWAMIFGRGIVATPADFGNQGKLPTHPELLDWLATRFVESGWNLKALQKQLVMSAAYRQSSLGDAKSLEVDPANDLLSRGPSYRLASEQIRDAALAASGLLVRTIGGPSVYPYQPPGLWEALATRNATKYEQGHGEALYRRSLYTVWKRSSPPPSAINFDAAERLFCTVNRQRTNTPLQSLVLMNDPQYVEASRVLAERMMREGGSSPADRIVLGFRLLTSRRPDAAELASLERLYTDQRAEFAHDRKAALALLTLGEHRRDPALDPIDTAACAIVATTVMNFDEAVFKR
jgi:hypothetical protein